MGILLCEQNFRDVWRRNKSVRAEIGKILRTHTHTHAAQLVVRMSTVHPDRLQRRVCPNPKQTLRVSLLSAAFILVRSGRGH